jgi:hypothetical protein
MNNTDISKTLEERGERYGEFINHAFITQSLKKLMEGRGQIKTLQFELIDTNWYRLAPDQKEALEMIAHKIGRILNGDPNYADSWVDIAGYAKLVADRLEGETK